MSEILVAALRFRRLGFAVHWLRPSSKIPVLAGWADAVVMTERELADSYRPGYNVGFRPGVYSAVDGNAIVVVDVDVRGGEAYADEAHAAARALAGGLGFHVVSGSGVGRHIYVACPLELCPQSAATTLRRSDVETTDGKPAWMIELLSTGKNVVLPPSVHPDTGRPYQLVPETTT